MPSPNTAPQSYELILKRRFRQPPGRLFEAFTTPELLVQWYRPNNDEFTTPLAEVDLRVGGKYKLVIRNEKEGKDNVAEGEYLEIVPGEKLVYTWAWTSNKNFTQETQVTIELRPDGTGTELTLTHAGFPDTEKRDSHNWGHSGALEMLAGFLEA